MTRTSWVLPHPVPKAKWRSVAEASAEDLPALTTAFIDACRKPGWNPRTVKLSDGTLAIDFCSDGGGSLASYKVALIEDHPFLATLPLNAPRAVRHPYKAATRLRYLRATDGWGFTGDMSRAKDAWERYEKARATMSDSTGAADG